jgi:hypothetical protein
MHVRSCPPPPPSDICVVGERRGGATAFWPAPFCLAEIWTEKFAHRYCTNSWQSPALGAWPGILSKQTNILVLCATTVLLLSRPIRDLASTVDGFRNRNILRNLRPSCNELSMAHAGPRAIQTLPRGSHQCATAYILQSMGLFPRPTIQATSSTATTHEHHP